MTAAQSPFAKAMALAKRLVGLGINPFQSDAERYVVLLDGGGGEIIDWGKPLRGTRFFEPNAIRKDRPMVADFAAFSKQIGLHDCVYWGIGLTGAKANADDLDAELKSFNNRINIEFSELRKSGKFEVLLLVIHPRYDEFSGLFDLHAHFVARVPERHRDAVKHRLRIKFSKTDFPDHPIRKAAATATYMLWGIFRNKVMIHWPDHALKAAWKLTESRFRFVRVGGSFARWRASKTPVADRSAATIDADKRRRNRAETADPRQEVFTGDRLLSKIMLTIRGVRTAALLFEVAPSKDHPNNQAARGYTSATNIATQEMVVGAKTAVKSHFPDWANTASHYVKTLVNRITAPIASLTRKIHVFGSNVIRRLLW